VCCQSFLFTSKDGDPYVKVKEKKSILFGKFTDELANKMKNDAWDEVVVKPKSLQSIREDRDADFVRDKLYGQWKSRALVI
jgi:hypothetical protein